MHYVQLTEQLRQVKQPTGLAKKAAAGDKTNRTTGASKVKTAGERAAENKLAADKATIAKIRANKTKSKMQWVMLRWLV
jgi:hypothetical protein